MTTTRRAPAGFYRAAEVAEMLRCSEWWIKEQARQRRIPYSWIGGSYLFTEQHITEIVRLFEVQPDEPSVSTVPPVPRRPTVTTDEGGSPARLTARAPRRTRAARVDAAA
jgi:hypothetical protein